jgi:hypothetical protein
VNEVLDAALRALGALHFETGGVLLMQIVALEAVLEAERDARSLPAPVLCRSCEAHLWTPAAIAEHRSWGHFVYTP